MKRRSIWALFVACVMMLSMWSFSATAEEADLSELYKNKDVDAGWTMGTVTEIDLSALEGSVLTISQEGDYRLIGTLQGQVVIETAEDQKVHLILAGVEITSSQGPAIYEKQADKLIVTLEEGTVNTLTDGAALTEGDDTIGAALYAEDDLSINGTGTLIVHGTAKHGIQSKSDLIIAGGVITVDAVKDGIRGRNSVLVLEGEISIVAQGDGIVSTRTDKEGKGWVIIAGGSLTIQTGDGAGEVRASANSWGGGRGGWGWNDASTSGSSNSESQKGVKAATDLTVYGGTFVLNTADDGLHGVNVTVNGGTFTIATGDDGMHADTEMTINGGSIDITQCYEGIEGKNVTITGGSIRVVASDDGINASGGTDGSGIGGRGGDRFSGGGTDAMLTISGGTLAVTAGGDGLDSNGSISITGGVTGVFAATSTGEGAIDLNGTGTVTGGTLIVASIGGVMQDTSSLTGLPMMVLSSSSTISGEIVLQDGNGNVLGSFAPGIAFDTIIVGSDQLAEGAAFTLLCDGQQIYSGTMTSNLSSAGASGGFGQRNNKRR